MTSTLFALQFIFAIILTILVLLQKSSSMGLGAYSGSNDSVFGAKGPANFLTKATFAVGLLFVLNTLSLGYFYNQEKLASAVDEVKIESLIPQTSETKASDVPVAPSAPTAK